jgi:hypothetical protein
MVAFSLTDAKGISMGGAADGAAAVSIEEG